MLDVQVGLIESFKLHQCIFLSLQNSALLFNRSSRALQRFNSRSNFVVQDRSDGFTLAFVLVQKTLLLQSLVPGTSISKYQRNEIFYLQL